jgi:hypothetical protein
MVCLGDVDTIERQGVGVGQEVPVRLLECRTHPRTSRVAELLDQREVVVEAVDK